MMYQLNAMQDELNRGNLKITFPNGEVILLNDYGIYVSEQPVSIVSKRRISIHEFVGRSGFLPIDNKTREPFDIELSFNAVSNNPDQSFQQEILLNRLSAESNLKFNFYHHPFGSYEGIVTGVSEFQGSRLLQHNRTGKIGFKLQPDLLINHNYTQPIQIQQGDSIVHSYGFLNGIFKLEGSGDINLKVGNSTTVLKNVSNQFPIYIDSLRNRTYVLPYRSRSDLKYDSRYPVFDRNSKITWTGNVKKLELTLDWRL